MKYVTFLIFFTVFIGIYSLGNWYLFNRGMQALPIGTFRALFPWIFWITAATFVVGQFLERGHFTYFSQVVTYIGSFWLVFAWYALLFVIAIDLIRVANHFLHFIPQAWVLGFLSGKFLFAGVTTIALSLVAFGAINAYIPKIRNIEIEIDKPATKQKEIKIALVSDIHMGFIIGDNRIKRLVNRINTINPDILLLAGDLVDHNPKPVIRKDLGRHFKNVNTPLGMYAVTGNHEYIGTPDASIDYLAQYGIQYVHDTSVVVNDMLVIAGREDRDKRRFTNEKRKTVSSLLSGVDNSKPVILMDHQPVEYDIVKDANVDLMVSGHTHKGQFWPFGYITRRVYEHDWGYLKKENTNYYVSSGYGTWGPPVRIGSRSEIIVITLKLKE